MANVQTNFRAVDMPGSAPVAPRPAAKKVAPVVAPKVEVIPEPAVEVEETEAGE